MEGEGSEESGRGREGARKRTKLERPPQRPLVIVLEHLYSALHGSGQRTWNQSARRAFKGPLPGEAELVKYLNDISSGARRQLECRGKSDGARCRLATACHRSLS